MTTIYTNYDDPVEARGYRTADITTAIVNRLPDHSPIRREWSSTGYQFLDQAAGVPLDEIHKEVRRGVRDSYLETTSIDAPDHVWRYDSGGKFNLTTPGVSVNLIKNSSFEINSDEYWFADDWDWNSVGSLTSVTGQRSGRALRLTAGGTIAQRVEIDGSTGTRLSSLGWFRTSGAGTLRLRVGYNNNTILDFDLPITSGSWSSVLGTAPLATKPFHWIEVYVICSTGWLEADNLLVRFGQHSEFWRPKISDSYRGITPASLPPIVVVDPRFVQFTGLTENAKANFDWWHSPPTRLERISGPTPYGRTAEIQYPVGDFTDFWKTRYPMVLRKIANTIQTFLPANNDELVNHSLYFHTLDGEFYARSYTLEAFTVQRRHVVAVLSMADYTGASKRYLAFAKFETPGKANEDVDVQTDYLEVQATLELPINQIVTDVWFPTEAPDLLYVSESGSEYGFRLYHDYMLLDQSRGYIFTHELYPGIVLLAATDRTRGV